MLVVVLVVAAAVLSHTLGIEIVQMIVTQWGRTMWVRRRLWGEFLDVQQVVGHAMDVDEFLIAFVSQILVVTLMHRAHTSMGIYYLLW